MKHIKSWLNRAMPGLYTYLYHLKHDRQIGRQAKELRNTGLRTDSVEELVELAVFDGHPRIHQFWSNQKRSEISALLKRLNALNPVYLCEIGAFNGGTLFLFSQIAAPNATLISLDVNYPIYKKRVLKKFARHGQHIHCVEGDSHSTTTVAQIKKVLRGNQLDFLFIDGDHSYEGVKTDFDLYSPLVRKGGLIAFHDIVYDHGRSKGIETDYDSGEVPSFWKKIRSQYPSNEYINNPDQSGYGIGVIEW